MTRFSELLKNPPCPPRKKNLASFAGVARKMVFFVMCGSRYRHLIGPVVAKQALAREEPGLRRFGWPRWLARHLFGFAGVMPQEDYAPQLELFLKEIP